jgi:hypothetical protein
MSLGESNYQYLATLLGYPSWRTPQRWTAEQSTEISPLSGNILDGTPQHLGEVIDLYLSWGDHPPCGLTISWDAVITMLYLAVLEDGEVLGTVEPLRISRADAEAVRKDDHLKAAFVERHPHLGAKAVHVVALTGFGTIPTMGDTMMREVSQWGHVKECLNGVVVTF